jgi:hypothetical protein
LQKTVYAPNGRGSAGLKFDPSQDVIIDLCAQPTAKLQSQSQASLRTGPTQVALRNVYPAALTSFLDYQCWAWYEVDNQTVELKTINQLPGIAPLSGGGGGAQTLIKSSLTSNPPTGGGKIIANFIDPGQLQTVNEGGNGPQGTIIAQNTSPPDFGGIIAQQGGGRITAQLSDVQQRTTPSIYLIIAGRAMRAGYEINYPTVAKVGNAAAVPMNRPGIEYQKQGFVFNWFGVPIVAAKWRMRYLLLSQPGTIGLPANPLIAG